MNTVDLTVVLQPTLQVVGTVLAAIVTAYVPKVLAAVNQHLKLKMTDQQVAAFAAAVKTAAGSIETLIDQRVMTVAHVTVTNDQVRTQAQNIIDAAPTVAALLGLTVAGVSQAIVAAVDTGSRTPPPTPGA